MATRRVIKAVLHNFLGTYTSRYSEQDGYWVFGLLVDTLDGMRVDLLALPAGPVGSAGGPFWYPAATFAAQLAKAGLPRSQIREAWLTVRKLPDPVRGAVNGWPCVGNNVSFVARAVTDRGRAYERERVVFVAPHNPNAELKSARSS